MFACRPSSASTGLANPRASSRSCSPTSKVRPSSSAPSRHRTPSPPLPCTAASCGRSSSGTAATSNAPRATRSSSSSRMREPPWPPQPTPNGCWLRRPGPGAGRYGCAWACTRASPLRSVATTWGSTSTGLRASHRQATVVRCSSRGRPAPPQHCPMASRSGTSASTGSRTWPDRSGSTSWRSTGSTPTSRRSTASRLPRTCPPPSRRSSDATPTSQPWWSCSRAGTYGW